LIPIHLLLVLGASYLLPAIGLQVVRALEQLRAWLSTIIDMILSFQG
jgi:hypothetical protein